MIDPSRLAQFAREGSYEETRICTICGDYFTARRTYGKKIHQTWCQECHTDLMRHHKLAKYGLTRETFARMVEAQHGRCAICGEKPTDRNLSIDHDHASGVVRGLLCGNCNTGIGMFRDRPDVLLAAVEYLRKHGCK